MSSEKPPLVKVVWLDAWGGEDEDYTLAETKDLEPQRVETIGFLLEKNAKCVKVAMNYQPRNRDGCSNIEDEFNYLTIVPKGCVLQIKELKEA